MTRKMGSPIDLDTWRELSIAVGEINNKLEQELSEQCDLLRSEFDLMGALLSSREEQLRMSELLKQLLITPSGLTRIVDRLVRKRLLRKLAVSDDKRGAAVSLLPRGLAVYLRAKDVCSEVLRNAELDGLLIAQLAKRSRAVTD